jgi:hypothetical protein
MKAPAWLTEWMERRRLRAGTIAQSDGDFRGPYGFGHRAHRPDPQARYGFDTPPPKPDGSPTRASP